jgi:hypothetical protein
LVTIWQAAATKQLCQAEAQCTCARPACLQCICDSLQSPAQGHQLLPTGEGSRQQHKGLLGSLQLRTTPEQLHAPRFFRQAMPCCTDRATANSVSQHDPSTVTLISAGQTCHRCGHIHTGRHPQMRMSSLLALAPLQALLTPILKPAKLLPNLFVGCPATSASCSPDINSLLLRKPCAALCCLLLLLNHRHCWTTSRARSCLQQQNPQASHLQTGV